MQTYSFDNQSEINKYYTTFSTMSLSNVYIFDSNY
jgi:hypothetical protein